jgi:hypothetical protein
MRNFKFYAPTILFLAVLFMGFSSCKKKCVIEKEGTDSGVIDTTVFVYPQYGYITNDMSGNYHVDETSALENKFQMSVDGGQTKIPVNYTAYSILAYPMTLSCNFSMERNVVINDIAQTVTYTIKVTQCKDPKCVEKRFMENFIIVPSFPDTYTVNRSVSIVEI